MPDPSQPPASGLVGGRRVVWIEAWEPCSEGDACARNVGYFATEQGSGSLLATRLTPQKLPTVAEVLAGIEYTEAMKKCDEFLTALFGEQGAIMAANSLDRTKPGYKNGKRFPDVPQYRGDYTDSGGAVTGHLNRYAAHLYNSKVYVPLGGESLGTPTAMKRDEETTIDYFYYKKLGGLSDVTLGVLHVKRGTRQVVGGRLFLGTTGGLGGDSPGEVPHVHIEIFEGRLKNYILGEKSKHGRVPINSLCPGMKGGA